MKEKKSSRSNKNNTIITVALISKKWVMYGAWWLSGMFGVLRLEGRIGSNPTL